MFNLAVSPDSTERLGQYASAATGIQKGQRLTFQQIDAAVAQLVETAANLQMIPIACILSRPVDGLQEVLGFGWNRLRDGIPGIHGETGAIINMGRLPEGYRDLVATSSLSPCPFCQCTLARQMGMTQIRILDDQNYKPNMDAYRAMGLQPEIVPNQQIIKTFGRWVNDPLNATIWDRDIGIFSRPFDPPFSPSGRESRYAQLTESVLRMAEEATRAQEAPIGALVIDSAGEILGAGHSAIKLANDPSMVAAMAAWRNARTREHWKDKTLILSAGPDHIAYSMFQIFGFGQLVVLSDAVFRGRIDDVRKLGVPVHVLGSDRGDLALRDWIDSTGSAEVQEYLGADYRAN